MATINATPADDVIQPGAPFTTVPAGGTIIFDGTLYSDGDVIPSIALAGNDQIFGQAGMDELDGGAGNDTLLGGPDVDALLDGGEGFDFVSYEDELFGVFADLGDGFSGPDGFFIIDNVEGLIGSNFSDNLRGDAEDNALVGRNGNDELRGRAGNDTLQGGDGSDTGFGANGNDLVQGGAGNDSLLGGNGDDTLQGGDDNDTLLGGAGNDLLQAGEGADSLIGGGGEDTLEGGNGNDIYRIDALGLAGGTRIEDTAGGADRLELDPSLTVFALNPNMTNVGLARDGQNLILDINRNGEADPDTDLTIINFYANVTDNTAGTGFIEDLNGLPGVTVLNNDISNIGGLPGTLVGTNNNDNLVGTTGDEVIRGLQGNDTITGNGGADDLQGGAGNDTYTINSLPTVGGTRVDDAGGVDSIDFTPPLNVTVNPPSPGTTGVARIGADLIIDINRDGQIDPDDDLTLANFFEDATSTNFGPGFIDTIEGLSGFPLLAAVEIPSVTINSPTPNNVVSGQPVPGIAAFSEIPVSESTSIFVLSNEPDSQEIPAIGLQVLGLSGNDTLEGTSSNDDVVGNRGADSIDAGGGDDTIRGGQGSDVLEGNDGNDLMNGNQDNDTLNGGDDDDLLRGGRGDDVLIGGQNQDTLVGDRGQDILTGGVDRDTFVLIGGDVAADSLEEADVITDFEAGIDQIMLTNGLSFSDVTIVRIDLTLDGAVTPVASSAIQAPDGSYLGIVAGAFDISGDDVIPEDTSVTALG
ncbi:MAG: hypothetical protein ACFBSC_17300 [Microcoleaceae cyanobacterium]